MPFHTLVLPTHGVGYIRFSGVLDGAVFLTGLRTLYGDVQWQPNFGALWDFCALTKLVLLPEDVEQMAHLTRTMASRMGTGRAAFVVQTELDKQIAMLLLAKAPNPNRERRLFTDLTEAAAWLSLSPEAVEKLKG